MPLPPTAIGHLCETFTRRALNAAWQRRPERNYHHEVVRSDTKDAYEIRLSAWWGRHPDIRERRLRFDVDIGPLLSTTPEEAARGAAHYIEAQVAELEASCDDVERGGAIRTRPRPTPWYGPVTVTAEQIHRHAAESVQHPVVAAGIRMQQRIAAQLLQDFINTPDVEETPRPPSKSLWQLLEEDV